MIYYLYKITNQINNKIYIGQTHNLISRKNQHFNAVSLNKPRQYLHKAMINDGIQNFIFEEIANCKNKEDINQTEIDVIIQYQSRVFQQGYNVMPGGDFISENFRKIMSLLKKGKHYSVATEFKRGRVLSKLSLAKMSQSLKGRVSPNKGRKHSEESKIKMSQSLKGRKSWNKGMRFAFKPNNKQCKFEWPNDEDLLKIVNKIGLTAFANEIGTIVSNVYLRLKRRGLKHNCKGGSPETTFQKGVKHKGSKLTEEQVLEIVNLCNQGNFSYKKIGEKFNVSRSTVGQIMNGNKWNHLTKLQLKTYHIHKKH